MLAGQRAHSQCRALLVFCHRISRQAVRLIIITSKRSQGRNNTNVSETSISFINHASFYCKINYAFRLSVSVRVLRLHVLTCCRWYIQCTCVFVVTMSNHITCEMCTGRESSKGQITNYENQISLL